MVKIAVDCRMLNKSGIGVYLFNILHYWLQRPNVKWLLIGSEKDIRELPLTENCEIVNCDIPIFSYQEFYKFPVKDVNKCDVFYSPNFNLPLGIKTPIYITVHDVVFLDYKDFDTKLGVFARRLLLGNAIKRAKKIFTVSEFSKKRIEAHFGKKKEITVAYNGLNADLLSYEVSPEVRKHDKSYLIFIGNIKRHKGIDVLIDAVEGTDKKLVIVGDIAGLKTADKVTFQRMSENKNIKLQGRVASNSELYDLIANAEALIQPSRYEGFGLPPLEALYLGTQVIVSDIPVFQEVYRNLPVTFFENENAKNLRDKILNLKNCVIDKESVKNAFSYKETAEKIFSNFEANA